MGWLVAALLILGVVAVVMAAGRRSSSAPGTYEARKPLTEPEQVLYWRLREAMPECVILSQVSFSRFLGPAGADAKMRRSLFASISQKTVDFLVCLPDFTLVAAVELDDGTHDRARDARRDAILGSAGVHVVRLSVRDIPSADYLRSIFLK